MPLLVVGDHGELGAGVRILRHQNVRLQVVAPRLLKVGPRLDGLVVPGEVAHVDVQYLHVVGQLLEVAEERPIELVVAAPVHQRLQAAAVGGAQLHHQRLEEADALAHQRRQLTKVTGDFAAAADAV